MLCISTITLTALSSCIKDDLDVCPQKLSLSFNYTYNVKEADAFSAEVKSLNVYVFDGNGKYFDTYIENSDKFETGHKMEISGLKEDKYTLVCLARDQQTSTRTAEDEMEFRFSSLTPGVSTIEDLTEKMGTANQEEFIENDKQFAALYIAQTDVDFRGKNVSSTLSLMKCTKTYRIVLLPYENGQADFLPENFDVRIIGSAAWLDHKGNKVRNTGITYLPYNIERCRTSRDMATIEGKPIEQALVYDLSSSRMFDRTIDAPLPQAQPSRNSNTGGTYANQEYDDKRIIITDRRDKENPKVVFNHSLPWFLALCGERKDKNWEDQEYLDRQDHYVLTFYVPDKRDYNLDAKVKVNGWTVNLQDTNLGEGIPSKYSTTPTASNP